MKLGEYASIVNDMVLAYGEDTDIKSYAFIGCKHPTPHIWYDEDADAVIVH